MYMSLKEKLDNKEFPKKILSLDGGGVKGILTLGMLKRIESLVSNNANNPNLLLGDNYDLISLTY